MRIPIEVRAVEPAQVLALRRSVLRPGRPPEAAIFDGEDSALHLAAFGGDRIVGVAALFERAFAFEPGAAWQLRGMAVAPEHQNQGIGRVLIEACVQHMAQSGDGWLWCNARLAALGFYRANGFEIFGEEFEIPDVGPHFVMARRVERASST